MNPDEHSMPHVRLVGLEGLGRRRLRGTLPRRCRLLRTGDARDRATRHGAQRSRDRVRQWCIPRVLPFGGLERHRNRVAAGARGHRSGSRLRRTRCRRTVGPPDGSFDLIVAFDVFEHIDPHESIGFLRTLTSKLADGGALLLRFPNVDTWIGNPFQYGDVTHVNAIGALKMQYYAKEAGLAILRLRGAKRRGSPHLGRPRRPRVHGRRRDQGGRGVREGAVLPRPSRGAVVI